MGKQNYPFAEADLGKVKRYSIGDRFSKVSLDGFAKKTREDASFKDFWSGLPDILQASALKELVVHLKKAKEQKKPIYWMMGGHVIKVGLSPILQSLVEQGFVQGVFMNSAASIHDSEIARFGATSEDVAEAIKDGSFGMAKETSVEYIQALSAGHKDGLGWGESLAGWLATAGHPHQSMSLLACLHDHGIPVTIHGALGTDIIWQHPEMNGAVLGELGHRDFKKLIELLKSLDGGAVLNWGSAVIMPEVFLKAFTVARNLGAPLKKFVSANFDQIQHYRPRVNILERPTSEGGKQFAITGHHELMMPLLAWALAMES